MSWSINVTGTKSVVAKQVTEQLDRVAASYEGKEEGKDILAVKERILSIVGAMDLHIEGATKAQIERGEGEYAVIVRANGSHAWDASGIHGANFAMAIGRRANVGAA